MKLCHHFLVHLDEPKAYDQFYVKFCHVFSLSTPEAYVKFCPHFWVITNIKRRKLAKQISAKIFKSVNSSLFKISIWVDA